MKRFAKVFWTAGVLGGLLAGVQTLTASPAPAEAWPCDHYCPCFGEPTCPCVDGPICAR
jgi:hypothetical protein